MIKVILLYEYHAKMAIKNNFEIKLTYGRNRWDLRQTVQPTQSIFKTIETLENNVNEGTSPTDLI